MHSWRPFRMNVFGINRLWDCPMNKTKPKEKQKYIIYFEWFTRWASWLKKPSCLTLVVICNIIVAFLSLNSLKFSVILFPLNWLRQFYLPQFCNFECHTTLVHKVLCSIQSKQIKEEIRLGITICLHAINKNIPTHLFCKSFYFVFICTSVANNWLHN